MLTRSTTEKQKCCRRAKLLSRKVERQNRDAALIAICRNIKEEVDKNNCKMPYGLVSKLAK